MLPSLCTSCTTNHQSTYQEQCLSIIFASETPQSTYASLLSLLPSNPMKEKGCCFVYQFQLRFRRNSCFLQVKYGKILDLRTKSLCYSVLFDLMMGLWSTETRNITLKNLALFTPKLNLVILNLMMFAECFEVLGLVVGGEQMYNIISYVSFG